MKGHFDLALHFFTDRVSGVGCQLPGLARQRTDQAVLLAGQFAQLLRVEFLVGFSQALAEAEQAGDGVGLGAYEEIADCIRFLAELQSAWIRGGERGRQAAAVRGSNLLDPSGQALP